MPPIPRPLRGVARAPLSSSTTPSPSDWLVLPPGNQDHARNQLHPLAVTLSTSDTVTFEIFGNFYLYVEEYHECWMEWWQGTPGDLAYTAKYAGRKKIRWNSDLRGCNMCTCSGNGTQERAVQDLLFLVDLYLVYLI